MKLQLWIINSAFILVLIVALVLSNLFKQDPPVVHINAILQKGDIKSLEVAPAEALNLEKIYQNDVFGTYVAPIVTAVKKSFITPIPEPQTITFNPPPEAKQVNFLPPLSISIKGIIAAAEEQNSVVMIADETNKEKMYHLGDRLKDAEIIRISRNKVVLLRSNGQQETFYLIKEDLSSLAPERWNNIVKKTNAQNYKIDPYAFLEEVETFGSFMERAAILGIAYSQGNQIGIKIGDTKDCDVANNIGLVQSDIITSVNGINTSESKNRTQLYDLITQMKVGDKIDINLLRSGQNISITYELTKLEKIFKKPMPAGIQENKKPNELPMNALQERDTRIRDFSKIHGKGNRGNQMSDLRKHLLENLHSRLRNARGIARR
ncbi:MAG: hypothetical protein US49_C0006G0104 [candidate division TM6 bacterium GW2011_GWF2_37_49]|nr:MAG: hypothetical protein US49_C0006G0104 [candidate division TM6 bacterium GW2011_GWF2_37_49]